MKRQLRFISNLVARIVAGKNPVVIDQGTEQWDRQYNDGRWDFLRKNPANTKKIIEIIMASDIYGTMKVLDIGCGNGGLLVPLSKLMPQADLFGIDVSKDAISALSDELREANLTAASIEELPIINTKFDIIVLSEILYYIDYRKVLDNLHNYAHPKSKIIISIYGSWRSFFIWRKVGRVLEDKVSFRVRDGKNHWKIMTGRIKT